MTLFRYKALTKTGYVKTGLLYAHNRHELRRILEKVGLFPISFNDWSIPSIFGKHLTSARKKRLFLIEMCFHLTHMLRADVGLDKALWEVFQHDKSSPFAPTCHSLYVDICSRILFSQACAKHPQLFDQVWVNLLKISEETGRYETALTQLSQHLKWVENVVQQLIAAVRYPIYLLILLSGLIIFLTHYLSPPLMQFLSMLNQTPSGTTQALIFGTVFLQEWGYNLLFSLMGALLFIVTAKKMDPKFHRKIDQLKLKVPLIGPLTKNIHLYRFLYGFNLLFLNKINILKCFSLASLPVTNLFLQEQLNKIPLWIETGIPIARAFEKTQLFSSFDLRMIQLGENTGALSEALEVSCERYQQIIQNQLNKSLKSVGPLLTLLVGAILGWVVVAFFIPLYENLLNLEVS